MKGRNALRPATPPVTTQPAKPFLTQQTAEWVSAPGRASPVINVTSQKELWKFAALFIDEAAGLQACLASSLR